MPPVFISRVQIAQNDPTTLTATAHLLAPPHPQQTDTPSHTPSHKPSHAPNTAPRLDDMMLLYEVLDTAPSQQVIASGSALAGTPIRLAIPEPRLWSPDSPFLYDLRVTCAACGAPSSAIVGADGRSDGRSGGRAALGALHWARSVGRAALGAHEGGDVVMTYFGLRTFEVDAFPARRRRPDQAAPSAASSTAGPRAVSGSGTPRAVSGTGYTHYTTLLVGPDLITANLSLSQAESLCDADVSCVGFTYPSKDPAVPAGPVPCTLKRASKLYFTSDEWQTYLRPVHAVARPQLNGRPIFLAGWLDQSYWPDGLYTAPTDEALAFDVRDDG